MQKNKQLIVIILQVFLLAFLVLPIDSFADENDPLATGSCGKNITYSYDQEDHVLTISGEGYMFDYGANHFDQYSPFYADTKIEKVIILEGVKSIGDEMFLNCRDIKSVEIPESVISIGKSAFENCSSLESIVVPDGVDYIGKAAFKGCDNLETVQLSGNADIDEDILKGCKDLRSIEIGENHLRKAESNEGVLFARSNNRTYNVASNKLELLRYPPNRDASEYRISSEVDSIAGFAFENANQLNKVEIPTSVKYIPSDAFYGANPALKVLYKGSILDWFNAYAYNVDYLLGKEGGDSFADWADIQFAEKADLKDCRMQRIPDQTWTGKQIRVQEVPTLGYRGEEPATVKAIYKNNIKVGKATVCYTGNGEFKGTRTVHFKIVPKGTKLITAAGDAAKFKATWKKKTKDTDGYQIQFAIDEHFQIEKKTFTVKGKTKTSKICRTGLKHGRSGYVRVRTFKIINGEKYCSKWSKAKKTERANER